MCNLPSQLLALPRDTQINLIAGEQEARAGRLPRILRRHRCLLNSIKLPALQAMQARVPVHEPAPCIANLAAPISNGWCAVLASYTYADISQYTYPGIVRACVRSGIPPLLPSGTPAGRGTA